MTGLTLIVGGLATWRLSRALVKEDGPKMIFVRLRAYLASKQKFAGGRFDMISCVACTSFWVGCLAALWTSPTFFHTFGYGLAFSALAVLLEALMSSQTHTSTKNVR